MFFIFIFFFAFFWLAIFFYRKSADAIHRRTTFQRCEENFPLTDRPRRCAITIFESESNVPGKCWVKIVSYLAKKGIFGENEEQRALIACSHVSNTERRRTKRTNTAERRRINWWNVRNFILVVFISISSLVSFMQAFVGFGRCLRSVLVDSFGFSHISSHTFHSVRFTRFNVSKRRAKDLWNNFGSWR